MLNSEQWFDEYMMNMCFKILYNQFSRGNYIYSDNLYVDTGNIGVSPFVFNEKNECFLQYINVQNLHWVLLDINIKRENESKNSTYYLVIIYDSLNGNSNTITKKCMAVAQRFYKAIKRDISGIEAIYGKCPVQPNSFDCGPSVIANAYSIYANFSPTNYDFGKVRAHIFNSIKKGKFDPFPVEERQPARKLKGKKRNNENTDPGGRPRKYKHCLEKN